MSPKATYLLIGVTLALLLALGLVLGFATETHCWTGGAGHCERRLVF